jgi:hypothetical protein
MTRPTEKSAVSAVSAQHTPVLEVVFSRGPGGPQSTVRFDLGSDSANAERALRHAWNNRLAVVKTAAIASTVQS